MDEAEEGATIVGERLITRDNYFVVISSDTPECRLLRNGESQRTDREFAQGLRNYQPVNQYKP
uniref:Histidine kinase n=1 Tax=Heterorhabditis bacteriophora TaxID=37862 RepID=A0A1I7XTH1_HETBA